MYNFSSNFLISNFNDCIFLLKPYPVEKTIPYPVKIPVERKYPVSVVKHVSCHENLSR